MSWLSDIRADIAAGNLREVSGDETDSSATKKREQFERDAQELARRYDYNVAALDFQADRRAFGSMTTTLASLDLSLFRRAWQIAKGKT